MKVPQLKPSKRRSLSPPVLGSAGGSSASVLALCDGGARVPDGVRSDCMVAVESMDGMFEALRDLGNDDEAQTWSGRKPG
jgi:hypothetical protein